MQIFQPEVQLEGIKEITLTGVDLSYDGDFQFIEGTILPNEVGIPAQYIRTITHGKAKDKAREIMFRSWVSTRLPEHIPIPDSLTLILNESNQIVDIKPTEAENESV